MNVAALFLEGRTHDVWLDKEVPDSLLRELYDLVKWGPTSANSNPMRIYFVKSKEAKERLKPYLDKGNVEKSMAAPVTAIVAMDLEFYENLPKLYPHTDARSWFAGRDAAINETAFRNSSIQGGYFILAARMLGLDTGAMSGFNKDGVDKEFFAGTKIKSNFLCNIGYGDHSKLHPRHPRLSFEEACKII